MKSLASLLLLLLLPSVLFADTVVYVALAAEKKIAVYRMDPADGKLTRMAETVLDGEPGALTTDPRHRFLFGSLRAEGKLASFRIDARTGRLTHLSTVSAGADPAYLSTDKEGRFLLCAYYVAAKVTVHRIGQDGLLSARPRQSIPTADKAHAILLDPSNRFAFVPHTGPNSIFQFTFDTERGELKPAVVTRLITPEKTGPRHIVFHPALPIAYVDNRGHESIACFKVDLKDGKLTSLGQVPTEKTPRSFDIDPEGRFLYAAGEASGKVAAYRIDGKTGALHRVATYEVGRQPWWVMAVQLPGA